METKRTSGKAYWLTSLSLSLLWHMLISNQDIISTDLLDQAKVKLAFGVLDVLTSDVAVTVRDSIVLCANVELESSPVS